MDNKLDSKLGIRHYLNKKLKPVETPDGLEYPVYIQLTFKSKSRYFKSRLLYIETDDGLNNPDIQNIISLDKEIIEKCVLEASSNRFSMKKVLSSYSFYTQEIPTMVAPFIEDMFSQNDIETDTDPELYNITVGDLLDFHRKFIYPLPTEEPALVYHWIISEDSQKRIMQQISQKTNSQEIVNFTENLIERFVKMRYYLF